FPATIATTLTSSLLYKPASIRQLAVAASQITKSILFPSNQSTGRIRIMSSDAAVVSEAPVVAQPDDGDKSKQQQQRPQQRQKLVLKVPKGMHDRPPVQMSVREDVLQKIVSVFKSHDAECLETPGAELKEVLTGKYGEDSKLIYDICDQGGELLSLRYDLTVPFARYVAMNKLQSMRRYQIGPVYRRDQPAMTRGRYREFYQCDFDIAGESEPMLADSECVLILTEVLSGLGFSNYTVRVNHRLLLDGIFQCCGVSEALFRPICSAVDKLDKCSWDEVAKEMSDKGLADEPIERIRQLVLTPRGSADLVDQLRENPALKGNAMVTQALDDMSRLFRYLGLLGCPDQVRFDLSLARGLDYYTGLIYEAVLEPTPDCNVTVGSVAGGGRYDKLVGMFTKKDSIPRLRRLSPQVQIVTLHSSCPHHLNRSGSKNLLEERLRLCGQLWRAGLPAAHSLRSNPKLLTQFQYCEDTGVPIALIIGESELRDNKVKLRCIASRKERLVDRDSCVDEVRAELASLAAAQQKTEQ
uniref:histidine--tRNA ligase n=1 Tax=Macrostomum lignano TaxID=282301 RepID=A0A1I8JA60_9PLAT